MGFTISYKTLFEVKILHHYFLNRVNDVFDNMLPSEKAQALKGYDVQNFIHIKPTPETVLIMSKHHCIYRNTPTGLLIGLQTVQNGNKFFPAFDLDDNLRFSFTMQFIDPYFTNYTALPLIKNHGSCYYLQNRKSNAAKRFPFLTQFPSKFTAGTYSAGDILGDSEANPAQLFIANKLTTSDAPGADWINDTLVSGKPLQYLTQKDILPLYENSIRFNTGETGLNLSIIITNRWGDSITPKFETGNENDSSTALVDIHQLPEDLYTIRLEDAAKPYSKEFSFYHLPYDTGPDIILDLVIKSDEAAYNMIAADGSLREPVYELRFRNRFTKWRYLGLKFTTAPEVGPHPLTKKGLVDVSAVNDDGNVIDDLPNPNIRIVKTEHPVNDNKHYNIVSEIYIH